MTDELPGDHVALSFVGTVSERDTTRVELLPTPADLDLWLVRTGIVDRPTHATDAQLQQAHALREAIYSVLRAATSGATLPRRALRVVNDMAATSPVQVRLVAAGRRRRHADAQAALGELARSAVDLIGGPDLTQVRWCAADECTHPFLDRSRGGRRRWCGMTGCGDRMKARAYRARRRVQN